MRSQDKPEGSQDDLQGRKEGKTHFCYTNNESLFYLCKPKIFKTRREKLLFCGATNKVLRSFIEVNIKI